MWIFVFSEKSVKEPVKINGIFAGEHLNNILKMLSTVFPDPRLGALKRALIFSDALLENLLESQKGLGNGILSPKFTSCCLL